jgi:hypothetical protein
LLAAGALGGSGSGHSAGTEAGGHGGAVGGGRYLMLDPQAPLKGRNVRLTRATRLEAGWTTSGSSSTTSRPPSLSAASLVSTGGCVALAERLG